MALPILQVPKYDLELLSKKEKITYRPFLVKEQKVLMQALETGEKEDAIKAMIDCATACTFEEVDITELPMFDLERLFLNIRAKSVGEIVPINVKCDACNAYTPYDLNLIADMKIANAEGPWGKVDLRPDYGIVLAYPKVLDFADATKMRANGEIDPVDFYYSLGKSCLTGVYTGEDFYTTADASKEEIDQIFGNFGASEFGKLKEAFDSLPAISYDIAFTCKSCGAENKMHVEGLDSFFG